MSDERIVIIRQVKGFDEDDWAIFAREQLELDDDIISEIEDKGSTFIQKKYNMVKRWMKRSETSNTIDKLMKLKERFFSGNSVSIPVSKGEGGIALIICNKLSAVSTVHKEDSNLMKELWCDFLGCKLFEDKVHLNRNALEMNGLIARFSEMKNKYKFGVIVISSHGNIFTKEILSNRLTIGNKPSPEDDLAEKNEGKIEFDKNTPDPVQVITCADNTMFIERDIMRHFDVNSSWKDIPKFFILDYCRGEKTYTLEDGIKADGRTEVKVQTMCSQAVIPIVKEFVAIYATHGAYRAYAPESDSPSWLIDSIYQIFKDNWKIKSLSEMLIMVNEHMEKRVYKGQYKAMSVVESTLTTNFKFH